MYRTECRRPPSTRSWAPARELVPGPVVTSACGKRPPATASAPRGSPAPPAYAARPLRRRPLRRARRRPPRRPVGFPCRGSSPAAPPRPTGRPLSSPAGTRLGTSCGCPQARCRWSRLAACLSESRSGKDNGTTLSRYRRPPPASTAATTLAPAAVSAGCRCRARPAPLGPPSARPPPSPRLAPRHVSPSPSSENTSARGTAPAPSSCLSGEGKG
mmetsp:Transcript_538/g.1344  ORF Transcript_538/g.1344 Transcript_538/m.1344 type:complete len:215 (+) Transcript_538:600-1244(+)